MNDFPASVGDGRHVWTVPGAMQRKSMSRPLKKILRPRIAIRLFGICILGCLTGFLIFDTPYWLAGIWTALATAGLFYETVRFVDKSEAKLSSFLQALNQNDFSVTFYESEKSDSYDLHKAFNDLGETFRFLRSERESQHQLLKIIVDTAAVPMICFEDRSGEIYLVNDAAKKLFDSPFLQHIKALSRIDSSLPNFIKEIEDGEKQSLKLMRQGKATFLSVTSQHIIFKDSNLKLVAFHDVTSELASREAETWQKLLRVLTHEISNSAIPLSTLSSYVYERMNKAESASQPLSEEDRKDIMISLKTIEQRSNSVKNFVQNFKSVNQIPEPVLERLAINELLDEVHNLFFTELKRENVTMKIHSLKEPCIVHTDRSLSMQVLINLLKNAIEAMSNFKENKSISLNVEKMGRYVNLSIADTGCGIAADDLDHIFIPFYSTKKSGSGIGLSISQQIMQKQRGDISVQSVPGKGSVFTVTFSR
jgi:two-component system, NtrC family, nitrogen regulation sensor histidine kinase NtrY